MWQKFPEYLNMGIKKKFLVEKNAQIQGDSAVTARSLTFRTAEILAAAHPAGQLASPPQTAALRPGAKSASCLLRPLPLRLRTGFNLVFRGRRTGTLCWTCKVLTRAARREGSSGHQRSAPHLPPPPPNTPRQPESPGRPRRSGAVGEVPPLPSHREKGTWSREQRTVRGSQPDPRRSAASDPEYQVHSLSVGLQQGPGSFWISLPTLPLLTNTLPPSLSLSQYSNTPFLSLFFLTAFFYRPPPLSFRGGVCLYVCFWTCVNWWGGVIRVKRGCVLQALRSVPLLIPIPILTVWPVFKANSISGCYIQQGWINPSKGLG